MSTWQKVCPVGMVSVKILNQMLMCGHISDYMKEKKKKKATSALIFF